MKVRFESEEFDKLLSTSPPSGTVWGIPEDGKYEISGSLEVLDKYREIIAICFGIPVEYFE